MTEYHHPLFVAPDRKTTMRIGTHQLANRVILAPMAGVTDRPFRKLCKAMGAGLVVSEMVSSNSLLWGSEKTRRRIDHSGEAEPRSVQIVGADPQQMAEAARYNVARNAEDAWTFIRWACADKASTAIVGREQLVFPGLRTSPYFEEVRDKPHYGDYVRILEEARHQRPVMPVQAFYMRELQRAVEAAVYARNTPAGALALARKNTQAELDLALAGS